MDMPLFTKLNKFQVVYPIKKDIIIFKQKKTIHAGLVRFQLVRCTRIIFFYMLSNISNETKPQLI